MLENKHSTQACSSLNAKEIPDLTVYFEAALNTTFWVMLISQQMSNTDTNKLLWQSHGTLDSLSRRLECWRSLKAFYKDSAGIKILSLPQNPDVSLEASWWLHVILQSCEALIFISILLTSKTPPNQSILGKTDLDNMAVLTFGQFPCPAGYETLFSKYWDLQNRQIYIFHR